jgi:hypothetical protein
MQLVGSAPTLVVILATNSSRDVHRFGEPHTVRGQFSSQRFLEVTHHTVAGLL